MYVLDNDDVTALEILREAHYLFYHAGGACALIALQTYEGDFGINIERAEKVDGKGCRTVEHAHEERILSGIISRNTLAKLRYLRADGIICDEGTKCETLICLSFHFGNFGLQS